MLRFNLVGIIGNLEAMLDHIIELKRTKTLIDNSWCLQKHKVTIEQHHIKEFLIHSDKYPKLNKEMLDFQRIFERTLGKEILNPGDIRELRNYFRTTFGEKTLTKRCPTCEMDKLTAIERENLAASEYGYKMIRPYLRRKA